MFLGADTEQLRECSGIFGQGARRISELIDTVSRTAEAVSWIGPDADQFRTSVRRFAQQRPP